MSKSLDNLVTFVKSQHLLTKPTIQPSGFYFRLESNIKPVKWYKRKWYTFRRKVSSAIQAWNDQY